MPAHELFDVIVVLTPERIQPRIVHWTARLFAFGEGYKVTASHFFEEKS